MQDADAPLHVVSGETSLEKPTQPEASVIDPPSEQASKEPAPPASPRLTDALEAALDNLLGPAPATDDKNTGLTAPTDVEKIETPTLRDTNEAVPDGAAAPVPASEATPAEGGEDANPEWEVDSSPYESSSSSSSDDSSDDESDVEESKLSVEETARLLMAEDGASDDDMDGAKAAKQAAGIRTKNEQPDEPEPKPEVQIGPEDTIVPLGIVQHLVEGTQVVIEALRDGTAATIFDRGTILCKEDRTVLGVVHDTIATVHRPMYILKFRTEQEVKDAGVEKGTQIWYAKSHAKFVFPSQLRQEKGSDASNLHDEEVGPDEMEYSDDEQEQAHKREKKNRKRGKGKGNKGDNHDPRARAGHGDSSLTYDDDNDDGPYKPLSRPANFGMGLPASDASAFVPSHGGRGGQHHQNRRGGDSRGGRGGRGRGGPNGRARGGYGHNSGHQSPAPPQSPHQPPPSFAANLPPMPGQWPFPIPGLPQFHGGANNGSGPPNANAAPNPGFPMPNWGAGQSLPFPFPPAVPMPSWSGAAVPRPPQPQQPPQQTGYTTPSQGGYPMPQMPYAPSGATSPPAPAPNGYQYPNYYGGGGNNGQGQNGQSQQRWG